ncbi:hypothetical protein WJX73_008993 [Symbiochloris irregularis]|uniref:Presenilin n=1 Tax=Symbiochloris irregularis TaxID=706552 RepID=A0AAW1PZW1_9CHLO
MVRSILDDLGQEVTGIVSPVSICMALTVWLVRILNPDGKDDQNAVAIANIYYHEKADDSAGTKITGAAINAAIFVLFVGIMTFALVCLYKHGYVNIIWGYMGFAGFLIFFVLCGVLLMQLIELYHVRLDIFSFCYMLYNFSMVGVLTLFFMPAPLLLKQGYLIITSVTTAFVFTHVPAWTTWTLLIAMALYDLYAVLTPGGPLKMLLDVAQEREDTIPALIYEARAVRRRPGNQHRRTSGSQSGDELTAIGPQGDNPNLTAASLTGAGVQVIPLPIPLPVPGLVIVGAGDGNRAHDREEATRERLTPRSRGEPADGDEGSSPSSEDSAEQPPAAPSSGRRGRAREDKAQREDENAPLVDHRQTHSSSQRAPSPTRQGPPAGTEPAGEAAGRAQQGRHRAVGGAQSRAEEEEEEEEEDGPGLPEAIKLGLGDFIFYSVLVGRAAMYDLLTAAAAYLAIIAGLGATLLLLAIQRHALPALPFSIALGVAFYFAARWALEPFLLPLTTQLLYF